MPTGVNKRKIKNKAKALDKGSMVATELLASANYSAVLKRMVVGFTPDDVKAILASLISLPLDQVDAIYQDRNASMLERITAGALLKSFDKQSTYVLETILDRVHGRPKEQMEIKADIKQQQLIVNVASTDQQQILDGL